MTRLVDPLIAQLLSELPAVLVLGARSTGKTTTALRHAESVVRLDHDPQAAAFRADPDVALRGLAEPVLLDEWQSVPGVLSAVKRAVDADSSPRRFIVTGSARSSLGAGTWPGTWPGTGRLVTVDMHPLTVSEQVGSASRPLIERICDGEELLPASDSPDLRGYLDLALQGGFPEAALVDSEITRRRWLRSYLRHVAERDAPAADPGRDPVRLARYLEAYALNSADLARDNTLHGAAGISRDTGIAYRRLLSDLRVIAEIPAWSSNRLSRLVKSPKRYMADSSLLAAAAGVTAVGVLAEGDLMGRLVETFVAAHLRAEADVSDLFPRLHHLRDAQGRHEVDIVAEVAGGRVIAIEVKSASSVSISDARHLIWLREQIGKRFIAGVVLHTGPRSFALDDKISAVPISTLWA